MQNANGRKPGAISPILNGRNTPMEGEKRRNSSSPRHHVSQQQQQQQQNEWCL
jgi:hypothetical protein